MTFRRKCVISDYRATFVNFTQNAWKLVGPPGQYVKYVQVSNKNTRGTLLPFFGIFIANFEHISHVILVNLLLTLSTYRLDATLNKFWQLSFLFDIHLKLPRLFVNSTRYRFSILQRSREVGLTINSRKQNDAWNQRCKH